MKPLPCSFSDGLLSSFNPHRSPLSKFSIVSLEPTRVAEILKIDLHGIVSTAMWMFLMCCLLEPNGCLIKPSKGVKIIWRSLQKDLELREGISTKLGFCIVNLANYLYCMDHHSFNVEVHRSFAMWHLGHHIKLVMLNDWLLWTGPPTKRFMLHWNFPEFSINEVGQLLNLHCSAAVT